MDHDMSQPTIPLPAAQYGRDKVEVVLTEASVERLVEMVESSRHE